MSWCRGVPETSFLSNWLVTNALYRHTPIVYIIVQTTTGESVVQSRLLLVPDESTALAAAAPHEVKRFCITTDIQIYWRYVQAVPSSSSLQVITLARHLQSEHEDRVGPAAQVTLVNDVCTQKRPDRNLVSCTPLCH